MNNPQTVVGKVWKKMEADFPVANELEEEVRRQANEWKSSAFDRDTSFYQQYCSSHPCSSINTENNILVGLYRKRDIEQLLLSDSMEITTREATLRK